MDETSATKESSVAEAANAAANRDQAFLKAHEAVTFDTLAKALKQLLVDDEDNSPILVKSKIKRICDDVRQIKADMTWHRWLLLSIAGGIGLLALKQIGA